MITKLYLDNYKGFDKVYIPIEDVNFLVGDNSTGKSTVMDLLYLIDHNSLPYIFKFNQELKMGNFYDLVNKYSDDKSYFSFACEKKMEDNSFFFKWKFENSNGTPTLVEYQGTAENKTVVLCNQGKDTVTLYKRAKEADFLSWIEHSTSSNFIEVDEKSEGDSLLFEALFGDRRNLSKVLRHQAMLRFSPVRAQAKPYYDSYEREFVPEGDHIASFIKKCLDNRSGKYKTIIDTLNQFGKESSLFESVEVESLSNLGETPFSLDMRYGKVKVNISKVGYGVSQVMPLVVEMLRRKGSQLAIPQPEVHLHPKAQSAFGTLVFKNWVDNKNLYLLETHSEYLINRFRYEMHESMRKPKGEAQVLFFERTDNGNVVTPMPIGPNGRFACEIPDSYGDFFVDEDLKMLDL